MSIDELTLSAQIHKLASLGQISASIAHEINNPLAVIIGSLPALNLYRDQPEKFENQVVLIQRAAERISKIVSGIQKYARTSPRTDFKQHNLCRIIQDSLVMLAPRAKDCGVDIRTELIEEAPIICHEIEIEQVIINLVNNAIDAVRSLSERWVLLKVFKAGDQVMLQVRDSGKIDFAKIENKLFEPYFTTKPIGEGTGLGLSITKNILDAHQASIALKPSDSHTCFEIIFHNARAVSKAG